MLILPLVAIISVVIVPSELVLVIVFGRSRARIPSSLFIQPTLLAKPVFFMSKKILPSVRWVVSIPSPSRSIAKGEA